MEKIKRITIEGKELCLRKSGDTFRVVKPIKNADGSINWKNLLIGGSWWNFGVTILVIIVILGCLNEYSTNIKLLQDAAKSCMTTILP